jgi:hypothetical protein
MTQSEQAVLIWSVLAFAAQMQRVLTYEELQGFTGILRVGLGVPLGLIYAYCETKHYPALNAIVVSAVPPDTGFPADGYPKKLTRAEFLEERARVFAFNWSVKEKPRSEDFEGAQSTTA